MRQMGLGPQEIIEAKEVIIRTRDKEFIIVGPQVIKLTIQGQTLYQVIGGTEKISEQQPLVNDEQPLISKEDIDFVASQAHVSPEIAKSVLIETKGDIAKAIMKLRNN
jgi:nascent polypeptide-associated complex subunit alpha